jgi:hypothetical protein
MHHIHAAFGTFAWAFAVLVGVHRAGVIVIHTSMGLTGIDLGAVLVAAVATLAAIATYEGYKAKSSEENEDLFHVVLRIRSRTK